MIRPKRAGSGFTLIELMIVVAIIGILSVIAMPKFSNLIRRSSESSTKASLGALRSALSIYYSDTEGMHPTDHLECLLVEAKYLPKIPMCDIPPYHLKSDALSNVDDLGSTTIYTNDDGHWYYFNDPALAGARSAGEVWVGCGHIDSRNVQWTTY